MFVRRWYIPHVAGKESTGRNRYLLDSNIADELADDPSLAELVEASRCADILITHIQGEELARVPPHKRRREKMEALRALVSQVVETSAGDVSDGKHRRDSLLVEAAVAEQASLVTEDGSLRDRCERRGVIGISYEIFRSTLLRLTDSSENRGQAFDSSSK